MQPILNTPRLAKLLAGLRPLTDVYGDKEGRLLRLWKVPEYGLLGSVQESGKNVWVQKVVNPLNPNEPPEALLKRLEEVGVREWQIAYDVKEAIFVVWPCLKAEGKGDSVDLNAFHNMSPEDVKATLRKQGFGYVDRGDGKMVWERKFGNGFKDPGTITTNFDTGVIEHTVTDHKGQKVTQKASFKAARAKTSTANIPPGKAPLRGVDIKKAPGGVPKGFNRLGMFIQVLELTQRDPSIKTQFGEFNGMINKLLPQHLASGGNIEHPFLRAVEEYTHKQGHISREEAIEMGIEGVSSYYFPPLLPIWVLSSYYAMECERDKLRDDRSIEFKVRHALNQLCALPDKGKKWTAHFLDEKWENDPYFLCDKPPLLGVAGLLFKECFEPKAEAQPTPSPITPPSSKEKEYAKLLPGFGLAGYLLKRAYEISQNFLSPTSKNATISPPQPPEDAIKTALPATVRDAQTVKTQSSQKTETPPLQEEITEPSETEALAKLANLLSAYAPTNGNAPNKENNATSAQMDQYSHLVADVMQNEMILDGAALQKFDEYIEQTKSLEEQLKSQTNAQYWKDVLNFGETVLKETFSSLNTLESAQQERFFLKDQQKTLKRCLDDAEKHLEKAKEAVLYPNQPHSFAYQAQDYLHSWSIHDLALQYKQAVLELQKEITHYEKLLNTSEKGLHASNKNAMRLLNVYREAMNSKSNLVKATSIGGSIFTVVGVGCMFLPGGQGIGAGLMLAGSAMQQGGNYTGQKLSGKYGRRYNRSKDVSDRTAATWLNQGNKAAAKLQQLRAIEQENLDWLIHMQPNMAPKDGVKLLTTALKNLQKKKDGIKEAIENKNKSIGKLTEKVNSKQADYDKVKGKRPNSKKKAAALTALQNAKAQLAQAEEDLKELENDKKACKEDIQKTEQAKERTEYLAPQQKRLHEMQGQYDTYISAEKDLTKEAKEARAKEREEMHSAVNGLLATYQQHKDNTRMERLAAEVLTKAGGEIAGVIGDITDSRKPEMAVAFLGKAYQIYSWQRDMRALFKEGSEFRKNYGDKLMALWKGDNLLGLTKELVLSAALVEVLGPTVAVIGGGWAMIRIAQYLFYGKKYQWSKSRLESLQALNLQVIPEWSPELETQLYALEREVKELTRFIDTKMEKLRGQIDSLVSVPLQNLKEDLALVHASLIHSIHSDKEEILEQEQDQAFTNLTSAILTLSQQFAEKMDLSTAKIERKKPGGTAKLVIESEQHLKNLKASNYTGVPVDGKTHVIPATHLSRKPNYLSGLIGHALGVADTPNWFLFTAFLAQWVDLLAKETVLKELKGAGSELKKLFLEVRQTKTQLNLLTRQAIPQLLRKILARQQAFRERLSTGFIRVHAESALRKEKKQTDKINTSLILLQGVLANIVAARKFYLHDEMVIKPIDRFAPAWDLSKLFMSKYKCQHILANYIQQPHNRLFYTPKIGIETKLEEFWAAERASRSWFQLMFNDRTPQFVESNYGYDEHQSRYRVETKRSLRQIAETANQIVHIQKAQRKTQVAWYALDLKTRNIVKLDEPKADQSQQLLLDMVLDINTPTVDIEFSPAGPVSEDDLAHIPAPHPSFARTVGSYEELLKSLIGHYARFLFSVETKEILPSSNPFLALLGTNELVHPGQPGLISLAFPEKLISYLRGKLYPFLHQLEVSGEGTFIPVYELHYKDSQLVIAIHFQQENNQSKRFGNCPVARFSGKAVRPFMDDLERAQKQFEKYNKQPEDLQAFNEFLLQALYAAFASEDAKFGLPGQGTYELKSGLIAPTEVEFPGCYLLWEAFPDQVIEFNTDIYTEELSAKLQTSVTTGVLDQKCASLFAPSPALQPDEGYFEVWKEIEARKQKIQAEEKPLLDLHSTLWATTKLLSNMDRTTFENELIRKVGIFPPTKIDSLFDTWLFPPSQVEEGHLSDFAEGVYANPSAKVQKLETLYAQFLELESKLDIKIAEPPPPVVEKTPPKQEVMGTLFTSAAPSAMVCENMIGFKRLNNATCYQNAVMQVLLASTPFVKTLQVINQKSGKTRVQTAILRLQTAVKEQRFSSVTSALIDLREAVFTSPKMSSDLRKDKFGQKDAAELILGLFEECGIKIFRTEQRKGTDELKATSHISSPIKDESPILAFPLPKEIQSVRFEELVEAFFNDHTDSPWNPILNGVRYNIPSSIVERRFIQETPELLVIQLKRFGEGRTKLQTTVSMPVNDTLDLTPYLAPGTTGSAHYQLKCVIDHTGTQASGHYTATIKKGDGWILADDETLRVADTQEVHSAEHYIYLFERKA